MKPISLLISIVAICLVFAHGQVATAGSLDPCVLTTKADATAVLGRAPKSQKHNGGEDYSSCDYDDGNLGQFQLAIHKLPDADGAQTWFKFNAAGMKYDSKNYQVLAGLGDEAASAQTMQGLPAKHAQLLVRKGALVLNFTASGRTVPSADLQARLLKVARTAMGRL